MGLSASRTAPPQAGSQKEAAVIFDQARPKNLKGLGVWGSGPRPQKLEEPPKPTLSPKPETLNPRPETQNASGPNPESSSPLSDAESLKPKASQVWGLQGKTKRPQTFKSPSPESLFLAPSPKPL